MSERRQIAWINPISALGALILLADVVMIVVSLQSDQRDEVLSAPNESIPEAEHTTGGAIEPTEGANGIATFTPPPLERLSMKRNTWYSNKNEAVVHGFTQTDYQSIGSGAVFARRRGAFRCERQRCEKTSVEVQTYRQYRTKPLSWT
jgi:hypothetical protein